MRMRRRSQTPLHTTEGVDSQQHKVLPGHGGIGGFLFRALRQKRIKPRSQNQWTSGILRSDSEIARSRSDCVNTLDRWAPPVTSFARESGIF